MLARLFAYVQYLLPKYWLTAVIYRLARVSHTGTKNFLIKRFVRLYDVETDDVLLPLPSGFANFNEFFIRELAADARPVDEDVKTIVSPVDGTVSQAGELHDAKILQAKGIEYSLDDLLAINLAEARAFANGNFATIYLAPYNYHRVHSPIAGKLVSGSYVPGDLFSVNTATATHIRGLFRRNERLILNLETAAGPAAVIFVGAMNVGSITTPWTGEIRPRHSGVVESIDLGGDAIDIAKGQLLGWFNMGSTVIVLLPQGVAAWNNKMVAGETLRMGESIGSLT
ncbi:MAG: archaetidylserine decarboxylase [Woeseiaceae bacterium]